MPSARCILCHEPVQWSNRRGVRLGFLTCPKCGGPLEAVSALTGEPVPRQVGGYKMPACGICGRRTKRPQKLERPGRFWYEGRQVERGPGDVVCRRHMPA